MTRGVLVLGLLALTVAASAFVRDSGNVDDKRERREATLPSPEEMRKVTAHAVKRLAEDHIYQSKAWIAQEIRETAAEGKYYIVYEWWQASAFDICDELAGWVLDAGYVLSRRDPCRLLIEWEEENESVE